MEEVNKKVLENNNEPEKQNEEVDILEEVQIEDLSIDGICGVY